MILVGYHFLPLFKFGKKVQKSTKMKTEIGQGNF